MVSRTRRLSANRAGQDETIVTFQGVPLGLAKRVGSRLKNSYPRELVRDGKLFAGKV
jgi:16S rRNA (cytosine1407-C5)-methyltransferase